MTRALLAVLALLASAGAVVLTPPCCPDEQTFRIDGFDGQAVQSPLRQSELEESERLSGLSGALKRRLGLAGRPVVYMIGDSLMRNQYMALCSLLEGTLKGEQFAPGGPVGVFHCKSEEAYAVYEYREFFDESAVQRFLDLGHPPPDVVYHHACYHLLHMHPERRMNRVRYERVLHYEEDLKATLAAYRQAAPRARLEVMTPFSVCQGKYLDGWGHIAKFAEENPGKTAKPCVKSMLHEGISSDEAEAQRVCERSFFTRGGSRHFCEAVRRALAGLEGWFGARPVVVDQWNVTDGHCDLVNGDGRHYNAMVLQQLDELLRVNGW